MLRLHSLLPGPVIAAAVLFAVPGESQAQYSSAPLFEGRSIFISPAPLGYTDTYLGSGLATYSSPYRYPGLYQGYYPSHYRSWNGRYSHYYPVYRSARVRRVTQFQVRLPNSKAEVWVEGKKQSTRGAVRTYKSPPLAPGEYRYTFRARWENDGRKVTRKRTVVFRAGERVRVDLRKGKKRQRR